MTVAAPPTTEQVIDKYGLPTFAWALFFDQTYKGDAGDAWTPTFVDLTTDGTPTFSGRYYRISRYLVAFFVTVTPGTSTTSTAGTTYIDNFPLAFAGDSVCWAASGGLGDGPGHIVAGSNRIYVPAWDAVTVPLTVIGIGEAT
jgi:hypothetical protein